MPRSSKVTIIRRGDIGIIDFSGTMPTYRTITRDVARVNTQICAVPTRLDQRDFARTEAPWLPHIGGMSEVFTKVATDGSASINDGYLGRLQCVNEESISGVLAA